ncbi:hypothetical protein MON38_11580 [Hymenobacter sp. DH14]|uniref:Uncharacterized protein n=1 Tax=Hymenobacter cyanobacteriorum TaxID=2926463 RepID=A0A9X2AFP3_9BACT|nr:hypothetical protein [Hymenobacter cyanobacteriorum]MCI1188062.1 hypothetical protein [Hymenobacter cyanobacteriorum]
MPSLPVPAAAPETSAPSAPAVASPRFLLKAGLQLTHLFYLPDHLGWQLVFPASLGFEYRLNPKFSLLARAEADIAAGRAPRGRRGGPQAPAAGAAFGLEARYYFNQSRARCAGAPAECWGNYVAFETSTDLSAAGRLRGGARSRKRGASSLTRFTPSAFVLVGTQHRGPGRHLLYDLSAGLGLEAPPPYAADATISRPWEMASQLNLRVYFSNSTRAPR